MSNQPPPGRPPGEVRRPRLDRAPAERYRNASSEAAAAEARSRSSPFSRLSGDAISLLAGALGALAVTVVYGVLATTIGLLAIAGVTGFMAGLALRSRPASASTQGSPSAGRAVTIAVLAMTLGILGGWFISLAQGGIAGPIDYVAQTLGLMALIVPLVAAAGAWLGSR